MSNIKILRFKKHLKDFKCFFSNALVVDIIRFFLLTIKVKLTICFCKLNFIYF